MEVPSWFGQTEFYAIIVTMWFGLIIYFLTVCIKFKQCLNIKENFKKIKGWLIKRKEKKEGEYV